MWFSIHESTLAITYQQSIVPFLGLGNMLFLSVQMVWLMGCAFERKRLETEVKSRFDLLGVFTLPS